MPGSWHTSLHLPPTLTTTTMALFPSLALGLALHALFNRYEPTLAQASFLLLAVITALPIRPLVVLLTLAFSIAAYRLSPAHPLAKFPGPTQCKLSMAWRSYHAFKGDTHLVLQKLHQQYGDFVRIGPNELSIRHADALSTVHGAGFHKGAWYDGTLSKRGDGSGGSLLTTRFKDEHDARRKDWIKAFTPAALASYVPGKVQRALQLAELLEEKQEQDGQVNISRLLSHFSVDVMGDQAFGVGSFELMATDDSGDLIKKLNLAMTVANARGFLHWLTPLQRALPQTSTQTGFFRYVTAKLEERIQAGAAAQDIFSHIYLDGTSAASKDALALLSDTLLIIIAGSDSTSLTLSVIIHHLIQHSSVLRALQAELDAAALAPSDVAGLARLPLMQAVIDEALRLAPASLSGVGRMPGKGGAVVAGRFVPEGTTVYIPTYVVQRDPRYFGKDADSFRPSRWLDGTCDRSAFFPFSKGSYACAGRPFALNEMRIALATILARFDVEPVRDWDPLAFENTIKDQFSATKGALPVVLKPRYARS